MTAPTAVACRCGHDRLVHPSQHAGMCTTAGCSCTDYRPAVGQFAKTAPVVPARRPVPSPPRAAAVQLGRVIDDVEATPEKPEPVQSVDELLAAAAKSELKPILRLADKILALAEDLRERVADETAAAGVKAHIAKLEKQLATERAKLKQVASGRRAPSRRAAEAGSIPCPDCDRTFDTPQGVGAHRSRSHGYRKAG